MKNKNFMKCQIKLSGLKREKVESICRISKIEAKANAAVQ